MRAVAGRRRFGGLRRGTAVITAAINSRKIERAAVLSESALDSSAWLDHFFQEQREIAAVNFVAPKKPCVNKDEGMHAGRVSGGHQNIAQSCAQFQCISNKNLE